jgi:hypothetical protein
MITASHSFFEKCLAGLLSAILGIFVVISCCASITPACCKKAEISTSQFQHAKMSIIATACCLEQEEHAILPLSPTPKLKFSAALPTLTKLQMAPEQSLRSTKSLLQQVFHKDHSKRYLELGVFLS